MVDFGYSKALECSYYALRIALTYGTPLTFVIYLQILISLLRPDIVDREHRVKSIPTRDILNAYDYIVIGAGAAGSVIANRLTEDANRTVLLVEAGRDESYISEAPALFPVLQKSAEDWQFKTEPSSTYCLGMDNHQCNLPRGKALGGSTVINYMIYTRGSQRDFNNWRDMGNPGWGYDDVLPYFKKFENVTIPSLRNSPYHGTDGYLTIERSTRDSILPEYFREAGRQLGYPILEDVNGKSEVGYVDVDSFLRNGLRCSTAKAFLRPASKRKNLHVSTQSMVEKILVDEVTKTAYGVQFRRDDEEFVVRARREVILSAGGIQSPQILMLSGIGPKEHLQEMGIKVIQDLPGVGQNLQDHVGARAVAFLYDTPPGSPKPVEPRPAGSDLLTLSAADDFLNHHKGPLYDNSVAMGLAFTNSKYNEHLDSPDVELLYASTADDGSHGFFLERNAGVRSEVYESLFGNFDYRYNVSYGIYPLVLSPRSRGYIKLRNADPYEHPLITTNYFNDSRDLDVLVEGLKMAYNVSSTPSLQRLNSRPSPNLILGCAHLYNASHPDEYFRCYARHYTLTLYHYSATCKMGPSNDTMAVVDPRLRVHGVKHLRVADASIMPKIVSAHTEAATVMIGEKASDLIKEDNRVTYEEIEIIETSEEFEFFDKIVIESEEILSVTN